MSKSFSPGSIAIFIAQRWNEIDILGKVPLKYSEQGDAKFQKNANMKHYDGLAESVNLEAYAVLLFVGNAYWELCLEEYGSLCHDEARLMMVDLVTALKWPVPPKNNLTKFHEFAQKSQHGLGNLVVIVQCTLHALKRKPEGWMIKGVIQKEKAGDMILSELQLLFGAEFGKERYCYFLASLIEELELAKDNGKRISYSWLEKKMSTIAKRAKQYFNNAKLVHPKSSTGSAPSDGRKRGQDGDWVEKDNRKKVKTEKQHEYIGTKKNRYRICWNYESKPDDKLVVNDQYIGPNAREHLAACIVAGVRYAAVNKIACNRKECIPGKTKRGCVNGGHVGQDDEVVTIVVMNDDGSVMNFKKIRDEGTEDEKVNAVKKLAASIKETLASKVGEHNYNENEFLPSKGAGKGKGKGKNKGGKGKGKKGSTF